MWAKCWMNFKFVNLVGTQKFLFTEILLHEAFPCTFTVHMAAYKVIPYKMDQVIHLCCKVLSTLTTSFGINTCQHHYKLTHYNFQYEIFSNVIYFMYLNFVQAYHTCKTFLTNESFPIYSKLPIFYDDD